MMMNRRIAWLGGTALAVCTTVTMGAEGGESPSIFAGDLGNIIWSLITFIAVLVVLGKFAWKPILGALQKREDFIRDSLEEARRDREQAEARLQQYTRKLEAAKEEASAIVEEGRRDAEAVKKKLEEDAKSEADAMIARARREIGIATDTAVKQLYDMAAELATGVASKVIRKELDPKEHDRLIAESIDELRTNGSRQGSTT